MGSIGRYRIVEELARGGMGVVYKALDPAERVVAVKVLRDADADPRFEQEARALAKLSHPGIVQVHGFERDPQGRQLLVMEFVPGESLQDVLRRDGPLPIDHALRLTLELAEALDYAHQQGVIHRDLKPHNVILTPEGRAKLTDFGLGKVLDGRTAASQDGLTRSGEIMGTPAYMPPEQAEGRRQAMGPRSDVYSLGATLYALLTGRPPFQAATTLNLIYAVLGSQPAPPSTLRPELSPALDAVLLRCLAKDPAERYPTAGDLAADLERLAGGGAISRVRWRTAAAGAAVICGVLGAGLLTWRAPAAVRAPARASDPVPSPEIRPTEVAAQTPARRVRVELAHPDADGARFVAADRVVSWSRTLVRTWSLSDGARVHEWSSQGIEGLTSVVGLPDGSLLAGGTGGTSWLGAEVAPGPVAANVRTLACDPRGAWVAVGDEEGLVHLVSAASHERVLTMQSPGKAVRALAFAPDGQRLAVATGGAGSAGQLSLWALEGPRQLWVRPALARPTELVFSADGERLVLGDLFGIVAQFASRSGSSLGFFKDPDTAIPTAQPSGRISGLALLGPQLLTCSETGQASRGSEPDTVALWDELTRSRLGVCLSSAEHAYKSLDVSPDGDWVLVVESPGRVVAWPTEQLLLALTR